MKMIIVILFALLMGVIASQSFVSASEVNTLIQSGMPSNR